jgi:hypothetical protein
MAVAVLQLAGSIRDRNRAVDPGRTAEKVEIILI